jgi:hypothetical protein
MNMSVDIINNCFNLDAPKSVQKIGLFKLQGLLPDYKLLYPLYIAVLIQTDYEIKQIILSDAPIQAGEEIFYSFGNGSFNYKLKSDVANFDEYLLANSLIELLINKGYDSLSKEHMQIFMICCGKDPDNTINMGINADNWTKFFQKFKDFLLVSICADDLVDEALEILHNFLTSPALKFMAYEESKQSLLRSIELLYDGTSEVCQQKFREYLLTKVVARTEDTDNALKKFFKSILQKFSEDFSELYLSGNLTDIIEKLAT